MLKINDTAPDFSLPDQDGKIHKLSDYRGKFVLIYFYPKDDTPGCTKEACSFRDNFPHFGNIGAKILGISTDSVASHRKFSQKYKLSFTILADIDKKVVKEYGVWQPKKFMGREFLGTVRSSYLINSEGKIVKIYEKVNPSVHAQEVIKDLENIKGKN